MSDDRRILHGDCRVRLGAADKWFELHHLSFDDPTHLKIVAIDSSGDVVQSFDLQPVHCRAGDVIVLTSPGEIRQSTAELLKKYVADVFPQNKVIVLADGLTIESRRDE